MEVAVRVKSYVATGETVTLKVIALDKDQAELFTPEELTFTVSSLYLAFIHGLISRPQIVLTNE